MSLPVATAGFPLLSVLIFSPLAAAVIAARIRHEGWVRVWTLAFTTVAALLSLKLYTGFDSGSADFQFVEHVAWIPRLKIDLRGRSRRDQSPARAAHDPSCPLCVLASWSYIKTRVKEFMICLLLMETAMIGVFCALDFILFFIFWEAMLIPMALMIGVWGGPRGFTLRSSSSSTRWQARFSARGPDRPASADRQLLPPRPDGPPVRPGLPKLDLCRVLHLVRNQGADVPVSHVAACGPRRSAHGRQRAPGQRAAENGRLRLPAVCLPITPHAVHIFAPYVLGLSVVAILYGGFAALAQTDLKKLVAYSSVGHMGFATLGIFVLNTRGHGRLHLRHDQPWRHDGSALHRGRHPL